MHTNQTIGANALGMVLSAEAAEIGGIVNMGWQTFSNPVLIGYGIQDSWDKGSNIGAALQLLYEIW